MKKYNILIFSGSLPLSEKIAGVLNSNYRVEIGESDTDLIYKLNQKIWDLTILLSLGIIAMYLFSFL